MNNDKLLTAGAVAFAAFAVWYITRPLGGPPYPVKTGQQQRDAGLAQWLTTSVDSYSQMATKDYWDHVPSSQFAVLPGTFLP